MYDIQIYEQLKIANLIQSGKGNFYFNVPFEDTLCVSVPNACLVVGMSSLGSMPFMSVSGHNVYVMKTEYSYRIILKDRGIQHVVKCNMERNCSRCSTHSEYIHVFDLSGKYRN